MKKLYLFSLLVFIPMLAIVTEAVSNSTGKLLATNSPGETAGGCAQSGCHNAGPASNNTGGGAITIRTNPVMMNNTYVPGQLYHMRVVLTQSGVGKWGFNFEALDNSGNANLNLNDNAGTLSVTDAAHTAINHPINKARLGIEHITPLLTADSGVFVFDWKAPASGTVNLYAAGVAANGNNVNDPGDMTYSKNLTITAAPLGINQVQDNVASVNVFPNPVIDAFHVSYRLCTNGIVNIDLLNVEGRLLSRLLSESRTPAECNETFNIGRQYPEGLYFIKIQSGDAVEFYKILKTK